VKGEKNKAIPGGGGVWIQGPAGLEPEAPGRRLAIEDDLVEREVKSLVTMITIN